MKNILIAGAWPYANNALHVGHLSALLPADVIARHYRINNDKVIYVSGTDSHGTPITMRAKKEKIEPSLLVNNYHEEFKKCFNDLNFSYDMYGITCEEYHKKEVMNIFKTIYDNGYIYEKIAPEDYCEKCQEYLSDRELIGICPFCGKESKADQCDNCLHDLDSTILKEKKCITCGNIPIKKDNKHLYFALSKLQPQLENFYEENKKYWRTNGINETYKYLNNGLIDRAATRQLNWGVDVPIEGYDDKKLYVWIEAVLGYLTMTKKYCQENNLDFEEFMTSKDTISYYAHGKDNIVFHTIIFPALLLAINPNYNLPKYIVSSEYVNMNDEKMSKSKGNGITINDLTTNFASDSIRYYFIINNPEKKDVNFSYTDFINSHNKHLVGEYGNFINRNLAFLVKKFDGVVPKGKIDESVKQKIEETYSKTNKLIEEANLRTALEVIFELVRFSNKYYDESTPWIKVKENIEEFNNITYTCLNLIANISNLLTPFMPNSSSKVFKMLEIKQATTSYITIKEDLILKDVVILFERIETKE